MTMSDNDRVLQLTLHPEAIMDRDYLTVPFDISDYAPLAKPLDVIDSVDKTVLARTVDGAAMHLQVLSDRIMRLRISPDHAAEQESVTEKLGLIELPDDVVNSTIRQESDTLRIETPCLTFNYDLAQHGFEFGSNKGDSLLQTCTSGVEFSSQSAEWSGHRFFVEFDFTDETVFGLGGRTMPPNRNGTTMDFFNMKVGKRVGDYGGFSMPFYLSNKGYGLFLNNPWPHLYFDMGKTTPDKWYMLSPGGEFDLFIIYGPEFGTIMQEFTRIVGRIPVPDRSLLGFWCSSLQFVSDEQVLDTIDRLHAEGYPCDVVVLDGPWRGGKNFAAQYTLGHQYPSNDMNWHDDFGDGPAMIAELKNRGVKTSLHLNSRNFHPDTVAVGLEKGLLRQHDDEVVVNLMEPEAVSYYESLLEPRIEDGVDIWWIDHADRVGGDLAAGLPSRNLFGSLWIRLVCELMAKHGKVNHLCLTRGSGIGGQKYALPWPGDTLNGIDAYRADVWFSINIGLAGFPVFSADLGGFTLGKSLEQLQDEAALAEIFDDENICRRLCQCIFFIPTPRIHNNWDGLPKLPWHCSERAQRLYKQMLRIRYELTPYVYSHAIQAAKTGEPIIRPMVYHHRNDTKTYDLSEQFYMGEDLIVAPVTERNATQRTIYLPQGQWVDLWTEKIIEGACEITVDAPLFEPAGLPVFVKRGAVLARQPFTLTLENAPPTELLLDLYPTGDGSRQILESESNTTTVAYRCDDKDMTISVNNPTAFERSYTLRIHHAKRPNSVKHHGRPVEHRWAEGLLEFGVLLAGQTEAEIVVRI